MPENSNQKRITFEQITWFYWIEVTSALNQQQKGSLLVTDRQTILLKVCNCMTAPLFDWHRVHIKYPSSQYLKLFDLLGITTMYTILDKWLAHQFIAFDVTTFNAVLTDEICMGIILS